MCYADNAVVALCQRRGSTRGYSLPPAGLGSPPGLSPQVTMRYELKLTRGAY